MHYRLFTIKACLQPRLAQWLEHQTRNPKVRGSSPTRSNKLSLWWLILDKVLSQVQLSLTAGVCKETVSWLCSKVMTLVLVNPGTLISGQTAVIYITISVLTKLCLIKQATYPYCLPSMCPTGIWYAMFLIVLCKTGKKIITFISTSFFTA